jgi:hypothetical protein
MLASVSPLILLGNGVDVTTCVVAKSSGNLTQISYSCFLPIEIRAEGLWPPVSLRRQPLFQKIDVTTKVAWLETTKTRSQKGAKKRKSFEILGVLSVFAPLW